MHWHKGYAALAAIALVTEIGIALFVDDRIVRPFGGDALAVVLVYLGLRAITRAGVAAALVSALGVAVAVEFGQLFGLVHVLGLDGSAVARTVLGTGFDVRDFAAYAVGAVAVGVGEAARRRRLPRALTPRSASPVSPRRG